MESSSLSTTEGRACGGISCERYLSSSFDRFQEKPSDKISEDPFGTVTRECDELELFSTRWVRSGRGFGAMLEVSQDGLGLKLDGGGHYSMQSASTDRPIPRHRDMFYYEVQILQGDAYNISIGFSSYGTQVFGHIGPQSNSWGYHSSGRFFIGNGDMIVAFGPVYEAGDIVGCGVDFYNRRIFFTQNAVLLGIVSTDSIGISLSTELCPAVGLASGFSDISIVANFDCTPLFWESLSSCYTKRLAALNTEARLNVGKPFFVAATRWRAKHRHNSIEVSHDGRDIRKIRPHRLSDTTAVSARGGSTTVFEDGVSYHEVEIVDLAADGLIAIGFADPYTETWDHAIGVLKGTWGYHSNGKVYEGSPYADRFAPTFQVGDIVGCGFVSERDSYRRIFYTLNGLFLGIFFERVDMKELLPSVSLSQTSESVRANFGHEPFAYAVEDVVKALEKTSSQPRWPSFPRLPSLPSEILRFVLDALHLTIDEDDPGDTNEYKRTINSCALTCRYWSRVCCPYLFESITIRSKEDLNTLLDLMARPDSHIPSSILRLEIWEGSDVWAHHVAMSLASKLPKLETVTHERMGDPTWKNAQRRTPPQISRSSAFYSAYQVVTTLVLKNHHFSSFAALTQLVKALPKLDVLKCEYLSWEERPYNPRLLRAASHLSTVQVEYGGRWELIQLFTARWGRLPLDWDPSSRCPELNPSDLSLVHELLKLIVRQKHPPTYEFSLRVCAEIRAWHLIINTIDSMMQDQRMRWCLVFSLHDSGVTGTAVVTYLTELRVSTIKRQNISYRWSSRRPHHNDQVEKDLFGNLLSCSQLDNLFSKFPLPYLRTVTIAVRSEEEVSKPYDHHATSKKIASTLREKLPYLQGSGKLSLMMA